MKVIRVGIWDANIGVSISSSGYLAIKHGKPGNSRTKWRFQWENHL